MRPEQFIFSNLDDVEPGIPEKPKIRKKDLKSVIRYDDKIYELHSATVRYLALFPLTLGKVIEQAYNKGMAHISPDGSYSCSHCNHYSMNIEKMFSQNPGTDVLIIHQVQEGECRYEEKSVEWASPFTLLKNGDTVMAKRSPCVIEEARIEVLAQEGKLDEFEVEGRSFDYLPIDDVVDNIELERKYTVRKGGLIYKIRSLLGISR